MALPITFVPVEISGINAENAFSRITIKNRVLQKPPYTLSLPYHITRLENYKADSINIDLMDNIDRFRANCYPAWPTFTHPIAFGTWRGQEHPDYTDEVEGRLNKARSNFISQLGDVSSWAVTLAEKEQAARLMTDLAVKIGQAVKLLRKKDYKSLEKLLGIPKSKSPKLDITKSFADAWLSYWFGIAPVVSDIEKSLTVMDKDFSCKRSLLAQSSGSAQYRYPFSSGGYETTEEIEGLFFAKVGCTGVLVDPNRNLLRQFGLVPSPGLVWELVPFSFVVDWFSNVGDYLNQWTDLYGVDLVDPFYATGFAGKWKFDVVRYDIDLLSPPTLKIGRNVDFFDRFSGFPDVTLRGPRFRGFSITRGATAIALLLNQLGK